MALDNKLAKAITDYSEECEAQGVSRNLAEQARRVAVVLAKADPHDVLTSSYFDGMPMPDQIKALRAAIIGKTAEPDAAADDEPAPKPRKSKKKDAD